MNKLSATNYQLLNTNGYISLISVIIVGSVVLLISVSILILGINQSKGGLLAENSAEARALSNACAEKTLMHLKDNANYTGNETITLGNGQCTIETIENLGGESRIIKTQGTTNNVVNKLQIEISAINPQIIYSSWQEVSDY